jgi:hypothetical protein
MNEIDFLKAWILTQIDQWGAKRRDERGAVEISSTVVMVALVVIGTIAVVGLIVSKVKGKAESIDLG